MAALVTDTPRTVLAIHAHPADPDIPAGGTLAARSRAGAEIQVCICADGDKGTGDPDVAPEELVATRRRAVQAAGQALGAAEHSWLGRPDGEVRRQAEDDGRGAGRRFAEVFRPVVPT